MSPTNFIPPQSIFSNGQITGNSWGTVTNIFLVDGEFATSDVNQGSASDFIVGNFNFNIPVGSIITGIEVEIIGKTGAPTIPAISLEVAAYDNTNGADTFYPYLAPIVALTPTISTIVIGTPTYLFGTTWTVDKINNLKLSFTANGDISLDSVLAKVYFVPPATDTLNYNTLVGTFQALETVEGQISGATAVIVTDNGSDSMTITNISGFFQAGEPILGLTSGATAVLDTVTPGLCIDCSSPIQVQAMYLALPFLAGQTKFYLKKGSFAYPNGTPVQPGDIGSCGGTIPFVFDESKSKALDGNFEENAMLDTNNGGTWSVLPSGVIEVDLGFVTQRGLDYKGSASHVASLMSDHDANSKVIISNNQPYNITLVRRCQVDTVFSPPITVQNEGINVTTSLHRINFVGDGVNATLDGLHNVLATITDHFVKVSAADTTTDYLFTKLVAGPNITLSILSPGANERILITGTGGGGGSGHVIQENGVPFPQEPALNFINFFTISDNAGVASVVDLDVVALANDLTFINALTSNINFQNAVNLFVSGSGAVQIDQTPDNGTYGLLAGAVNGVNTLFTVSLAQYGTGKLQVYRNGVLQLQGAADDWQQTAPGSGTFTFNTAPLTGDVITVVYQGASVVSPQIAIQWQDEGVNLGAAGSVNTVNITGAGATATRIGNTVTINVPAGGGSGGGSTQILEDNFNRSNFSDHPIDYNALDDTVWYWRTNSVNDGNLQKRLFLNSYGNFQSVNVGSGLITVPAGGQYQQNSMFIYNGFAYLPYITIAGSDASLRFHVIELATLIDQGSTNVVTTYSLAAGSTLGSLCCSPDGRIVITIALLGTTCRFEYADFVSTLVIGAVTSGGISGLAYSGAPVSWKTYKQSNTSNNAILIDGYVNIVTGVVSSQVFGQQQNVLFWGTNSAGEIICGRRIVSSPQGNPSANTIPVLSISKIDPITYAGNPIVL